MFFGNNGLFRRVHTAHGRTVILSTGNIAATHTLDESDLTWVPCIGWTLYYTGIGTTGTEHSLELDACHDIRINAIAEFGPNISFHGFKAGRENDRSNLEIDYFFTVVVIDGASATGEDALQTLGADAALQAPFSCFDHLLFGERSFYF
jgi:hypothetical protein